MSELEVERPAAHEYDPYYSSYIERVEGKQLSKVLKRQLEEILELLGSLSDEQAMYRYAEGKWSIKQVIGHLMDCERIFVYRALSIARGEQQSLPGFDQDAYVERGGFDGRSVDSLWAEYRAVRQSTFVFFDSLDEAGWLESGTANDAAVSVRALGYIITGHEAHHLAVLREKYLGAG